MKKRFFTFLMAVWALLSISQTVKADDVTVYFQCPDGPDGWKTPVHAYAYGGEGEIRIGLMRQQVLSFTPLPV